MKNKRLLIVCEAFGGGVFAYVSQLCNDMCRFFDVYLVYSIRPQTPVDYKQHIDSRVRLIELKDFGNLKKIFKTIRELRRLENDIAPSVIHLHSSIAGGIGRLAFSGKNNEVVYTPHGYAHVVLGNGFKSKIYYAVEKALGKKNAMTLTCCESEDKVARTFCRKTAYIETGVNLNELAFSLNDVKPVRNGRFTVFTLGRICVQKQPGLFNQIAKQVPEADFVWIGGGEMDTYLDAPNISVTGWKPREEALALAKGADAFILCSLGEAISMSLIEIMYMKKLILVSNVIGNKSVIKNGINGFVCNTPEDYARHIRDAMQSFPEELVDQAYNDVLSTYNSDAMKHKYINFYNELITNGSGSFAHE